MEENKKTSKVGLSIFIGTEIMFFAGLLSAYWVLRAHLPLWPPLDQPRYPVAVTAVNTLILLLSAVAFYQAERSLSSKKDLTKWLGLAAGGGLVFLLLQGYEWVRLLQHGMSVASNVYGGIFYLIVGSHAFHVLGGLLILGFIYWRARAGKYSQENAVGLNLGKTYWNFVVFLWPVLYVALYLL